MKKIDNKKELEKMVKKYLAGEATPEQENFLEAYFQHFDNKEDILEQFSDSERLKLRAEIEAGILEKISAGEKPKIRHLQFIMKVAAAILIFFAATYVFYVNRTADTTPLIAKVQAPEIIIKPGGNHAMLTLGDGTRISLDDAHIGKLTQQGSAVVNKTKTGQLVYGLSASTTNTDALIATNTIETPRGGEYQVVLPDGTKVWLNAASKLIYPTAFKGKERKVELIGEAYFEVAKNKEMPFKVSSGKQVVEVLGTHFNISAYPDDSAIKTTLLEGSVKVTAAGASRMLIPGQQATIGIGNDIAIAKVNTNAAIGWKNGYFVFSNEEIHGLMRKVARWYDVDIDYKGSLTKEGFVGSVSRFENISEVLTTLQLTGMVHFKVEGRRVLVMP
jgi:transmembrane sensor